MTSEEFHALSTEAQLREERLALMIYDGGMTEEEALAILDQKTGEAVRAEHGKKRTERYLEWIFDSR